MKKRVAFAVFCVLLAASLLLSQTNGPTASNLGGKPGVTGGFLESGGVSSGAAGSAERGIDNAIAIGSTIAGAVDTIVLCVRPIAGSTDVDVEGALSWREVQ